jgi:hypothetical protein
MAMAGWPHPSPVFHMEAEVKPSALGGAAMADGGMWGRERGAASDQVAKTL